MNRAEAQELINSIFEQFDDDTVPRKDLQRALEAATCILTYYGRQVVNTRASKSTGVVVGVDHTWGRVTVLLEGNYRERWQLHEIRVKENE